jgi:tRNA dimethylallyltransferase
VAAPQDGVPPRPRRRLVALVGPTAAGKTELALRTAQRVGVRVEVVSLDSRQLYIGLDVGTGKPTAPERARLPHHLLDRIAPAETFTAGRYRRELEELLPALWGRGVVPLLVGGAGFYLRAAAEGFIAVPDDPVRLREVRHGLVALATDELRARLSSADPASAARIHPNDRYRLQRALEILELTGQPASRWNAQFRPHPVHGAQLCVVHLSPPRAVLHERIAERAARWLTGGWYEEVQARLGEGFAPDCPGLRMLGYREVVEWVLGRRDREQTLARVIVSTRRYARQQETWFRKQPAVARGDAVQADLETVLVRELHEAGQGGTP